MNGMKLSEISRLISNPYNPVNSRMIVFIINYPGHALLFTQQPCLSSRFLIKASYQNLKTCINIKNNIVQIQHKF